MSATQPNPYPHPSLQTSVTPEQRDRAVSWLQEAYAEDRIGESELDGRLGQVLEASNRRELNQAFYGIVEVPVAARAMGLHPAYQPLVRPEVRQQVGRGAAGFAHLSVFFLWLLGPLLVFGLSSPGSYARREAAKAFNFQLLSFFLLIGTGVVSWIVPGGGSGALVSLLGVAWFVLTIVGGAKALQGEDWRNPVTRALRLQVLSEK
ncbi:MAG: DUF1707 and DUF4870 domain-containing protein [Janthinobacterium lividum]